MPAYLLDTQVVLWMATEPYKLSPAAVDALAPANRKYVSVVAR